MIAKTIRLVTRNYDVLTPMLAGDIVPAGTDLQFDRESSIGSYHPRQIPGIVLS